MKTILMSIQKEHNAKIEKGIKDLELRKVIPRCELPIRVLTYESGKNGRRKVVNEWVCDYIIGHCEMANADIAEQRGCVKRELILDYSNGKEVFGMHISNLKMFETPRALGEFKYLPYKECDLPCEKCKYAVAVECGPTPYWRRRTEYECERNIKRPPMSWCYVEEEE